MFKRLFPVGAIWVLSVILLAGSAPQKSDVGRALPGAPGGPERSAPQAAISDDAALLKQYCITCHNERAKTGGLVLDVELTKVAADRERWEKVVRKVKTGMMPPSGSPRPARERLDAFAAAMETRLDAVADVKATLDTPALHRLNRNEYANAIRDLLDVEVDVSALLPADGSSEGFDNVAEALSVSPSLIQGYVSAAMKISRLAVGDRTMAPSQVVYPAPPALAQDKHIDGLPIGTRGGMVVHHTFPLNAEYEFTIGGAAGGTDVTIDGERVTVQNTRRFRIPVTAGPHAIGVAVLDRQRGAGVDDAYSDFRSANNGFTVGGGVSNVAIMGPFNPTGTGDTPSRRKIFTCVPRASSASATGSSAASVAEETCARSILTSLARRAYRGTVAPREVDTLIGFYKQGRARGDFETGMQEALARLLVAPRFLYRTEQEPAAVAPGASYRISDT